MPIRIVQTSEKRGAEDWWDWEVHLEGDKRALDEIEYVEYTLHETFPNPVRRKHDPKDGFQLKTSGWGTFTLYIRIHYRDEKRRDNHQAIELRFDQPATYQELQ